jgi:hypothetical protein
VLERFQMVGCTNPSMTFLLPRLLEAGLAASATYAAPDAGANSKICEFFENMDYNHCP